MQSIFKIFQDLTNTTNNNIDGFTIINLPKIKNHKIGLSKDNLPLVFIECENETNEKTLDYNLESISIQFNQKCQLVTKEKKITDGVYTIIALKTNSVDLQEYFLNILYFVLLKLPAVAKLKELKFEVDKLISLFNKFSKLPIRTIQGLWAELLVIEQSSNPEYLIQAWHSAPTDKFDFNDGIDKIEVKSTSKSRRIHNFSLEQLNPNKNSKLIIASVFAVQTGNGKTIFDLVKLLDDKVKDKELLFRISEILVNTLGIDFEKSFEHYHDYQLAIDSLSFYKVTDIHRILINDIPSQVSNVTFDSDLTNVPSIIETGYNAIGDSLLFKSLGI